VPKYAVTLSNDKILTVNARTEIQARTKAEAAIAAKNLPLTVSSVRKITG
jgi:hypothetical protein